MFYGLRESLNILFEERLNRVFERHHVLAEGVRDAVKAWGWWLLPVRERSSSGNDAYPLSPRPVRLAHKKRFDKSNRAHQITARIVEEGRSQHAAAGSRAKNGLYILGATPFIGSLIRIWIEIKALHLAPDVLSAGSLCSRFQAVRCCYIWKSTGT